MKKMKVKNYSLTNALGTKKFDTTITLLDESPSITEKSFNQKKHRHSIHARALLKMTIAIYIDFINKNYHAIRDGEYTLSADELHEIRGYLGLSKTQIAKILATTKGTITKYFNGSLKINWDKSVLAIEAFMMELVRPGAALSLVDKTAKKPQIANKTLATKLEQIRYNRVA